MARACFPQWTPDGRTDPDMCVVTPRERMGDSQPHTSCRFSWWSWRRTWTPMPFHRLPLRVIVNSRWQCCCSHLLAGVLKRPLSPPPPGLAPYVFPVTLPSTEWRMCEECGEHKLEAATSWSCFYVRKQLMRFMLLQQGNAWTYVCHVRVFLQANRNDN